MCTASCGINGSLICYFYVLTFIIFAGNTAIPIQATRKSMRTEKYTKRKLENAIDELKKDAFIRKIFIKYGNDRSGL